MRSHRIHERISLSIFRWLPAWLSYECNLFLFPPGANNILYFRLSERAGYTSYPFSSAANSRHSADRPMIMTSHLLNFHRRCRASSHHFARAEHMGRIAEYRIGKAADYSGFSRNTPNTGNGRSIPTMTPANPLLSPHPLRHQHLKYTTYKKANSSKDSATCNEVTEKIER